MSEDYFDEDDLPPAERLRPEGVHGAEIATGPTEDEVVAEVVAAFTHTSEVLASRLRDGRQKSLALTHLEDAFTRAVYAAMGLEGLGLPQRG